METVISGTKVSVAAFREMRFDDDDDYYYEIINENLIQKSGNAPYHQTILKEILFQLEIFSRQNKKGELFHSPLDVYLDEYNKPQPDLVFISEENKAIITDDGVMGIPDLIIEIISPTSVIRDRVEKKNLYEGKGVKEFWLVDPKNEEIEIYTLQATVYSLFSIATVYEGELKSALFEGLTINLNEIFTS